MQFRTIECFICKASVLLLTPRVPRLTPSLPASLPACLAYPRRPGTPYEHVTTAVDVFDVATQQWLTDPTDAAPAWKNATGDLVRRDTPSLVSELR